MKCSYCCVENNINNNKCISCNAPLHEENKIETNKINEIDKNKYKEKLKLYYIYCGFMMSMVIIFLFVLIIKFKKSIGLSIVHYILLSLIILSSVFSMFFVYPKVIRKRYKDNEIGK